MRIGCIVPTPRSLRCSLFHLFMVTLSRHWRIIIRLQSPNPFQGNFLEMRTRLERRFFSAENDPLRLQAYLKTYLKIHTSNLIFSCHSFFGMDGMEDGTMNGIGSGLSFLRMYNWILRIDPSKLQVKFPALVEKFFGESYEGNKQKVSLCFATHY